MVRRLLWILLAAGAFLMALAVLTFGNPKPVQAACEAEPITVNTPTGIAGCEVWGSGKGSHYGPGNGVAMNFCTWERRHNEGCGSATITSESTGRSVTVPVVDFCDCYTGTGDQRVVDMQYGVLAALGLSPSQGLYDVTVTRAGLAAATPAPVVVEKETMAMLPDTAIEPEYCGGFNGVVIVLAALVGAVASALTVLLLSTRIFRR